MTSLTYTDWKHLIDAESSSCYSNTIARGSSMEEAVIVRRFIYFWDVNKEKGNTEMFIQPEKFCIPVGLSVYAFRKIMAKWESEKLVTTELKWAPLKKFYKLDESAFAAYLNKVHERGILPTKKLSPRNEARETQVGVSNNLTYRKQQLNLPETTTSLNRSIKYKKKDITHARAHEGIFNLESRKEVKWAKQLEQALKENRRFEPCSKTSLWPNEFSKLIASGFPDSEITTILDWYCANLKTMYVPQAFSAKAFRAKIVQIRIAMERDKGVTEPVVLSATEQQIVATVNELKWPQATKKEQLKDTIIQSIRNYRVFKKNRKKWLEKNKHRPVQTSKGWPTEFSKLLEVHETIDAILSKTSVFLLNWFRDKCNLAMKWPDWNGSSRKWVIRADNELFLQLVESHCRTYGIKQESITSYLSDVNAC